MPNTRDADVLCPFFLRTAQSKNSAIVCEGIIFDECYNSISGHKKKEYMNTFCCSDFKKCKHYRAVMLAKYSEQGGRKCPRMLITTITQ